MLSPLEVSRAGKGEVDVVSLPGRDEVENMARSTFARVKQRGGNP
jgi:hypothetical protein